MVRTTLSNQIQDYSTPPEEVDSSTREQRKEKQKREKETEKPLSKGKASSSKPITMAKSKPTTTAKNPESSAQKRGPEAADSDGREAKKQPKNSGRDPPEADVVEEKLDTKKGLFVRVWSGQDEIVLLEGAIQFKEKNGFDPSKDMSAFYDFIKTCGLHFEVTQPQVKDKLWRMKKKFEKHSTKSAASFANDHEEKAFELSRKMWSSSVVESGDGNNNVKKKKKKMGATSLLEAYGKGMEGMEEYVMRKGFEMLDGRKREEVEERLALLSVEELKLFLERNRLVKELGEVLVDAYNSDDD